jgi:hypothetical protein
MYVSSSAPLPQNSLMPPPAWQVAQSKADMAKINLQTARGLTSYECGLDPSSYGVFGPAVYGQVAQANTLLNIAGANTPQNLQQLADTTVEPYMEPNPPEVFPFNPVVPIAPPLNVTVRNPLDIGGAGWNDALVSQGGPLCAQPSSALGIFLLLAGAAAVAIVASVTSSKRRR